MSNKTVKKVAFFAAALSSMFALSACDVQKTQDGEMPKVTAEGGQLPKYDVETAQVEVGTETRTIEVPTAEVKTPSEVRAEKGEQQ